MTADTPTSGQFRRAMVTGASRGIGAAFATRLAEQGVDLVLVARSADRLAELADHLERAHAVTVEVLVADLLDTDDLDRVAARVGASPAIDLVVNNAGFGTAGAFVDLDADRERQQVALNVTALVTLSKAAAAVFRERGAGGICNVSSVAAAAPAPFTATYAATKTFVTSFTQALHEELRPAGVHVTTLSPGFTRTDFHDTGDMTVGAVPGVAWSSSAQVAAAGIEGVRRNRAVVVPGAVNLAVVGLSRALPAGVVRRVAGAIAGRLPG